MEGQLLTEKAEAIVRELTESGGYADASEVLERALSLLKEHDRYWADVRQKVAEGIADLDAGKWVPAEQVHAEARAMIRERSQKR